MIVVSIPAAEPEATARSPEKAHTVFLVEVLCNGRWHTVAKRYSEFQALHKRIKKTCKVPDFPPRRVPNWVPKVLEQRRQGLELYIQVRHQSCPRTRTPRAAAPRESEGSSHPPSQRPVLGFHTDPYVRLPGTDALPDTVLSGVLQGLYTPWSCCPRAAVSQGQPGS
uniref:Sorting nexin 22 n=1 Tax=Anser brachyrhynchus TaxID=132585 RepID=A0A8B9CHJ5_9AVES